MIAVDDARSLNLALSSARNRQLRKRARAFCFRRRRRGRRHVAAAFPHSNLQFESLCQFAADDNGDSDGDRRRVCAIQQCACAFGVGNGDSNANSRKRARGCCVRRLQHDDNDD